VEGGLLPSSRVERDEESGRKLPTAHRSGRNEESSDRASPNRRGILWNGRS